MLVENRMSDIGLRLRVAPEDLERLRVAVPRLASIPREAETRRVIAVHYDTPDLALAANGVALSLQKDGQGCVESLEWRQSAGGSEHPAVTEPCDREQPLDGDGPDFGPLIREPLIRLIPIHALATLRPVFQIEIQAWSSRSDRTSPPGSPSPSTKVS
ncbi:MAG: triphosphatase [Rhodospirillaceae bacterium]|jgi:hypothetical protein|nr:triphosphatase [Rhodospirillaceae bacterium]